jgi:protein PsiE
MSAENLVDRLLSTLFRYVEKTVLLLVGGLSLLAIGQVLMGIPVHGKIRLEDVLLIFIFVEIMAMANVYFVRHAVPFTYPMFIAVTALSRLVVLQGKDVPFVNLVYEGVAILLISVSILIIRYSQRYSQDAQQSHNRSELKQLDD